MPQASFILVAFIAVQSLSVPGAPQALAVPRISAPARQSTKKDDAVNRTSVLVREIIAASYPQLKGSDMRIESFASQSDYFKTRFGYPQYFFTRMRYLLFVNPRVFELHAPEAGVRAIIAHELAHALYFRLRNRVQLLGLVRLTSKQFTAEFEKWADLKAISLGYGEGLKEYRRWLYKNVPASRLAEKKRDYFSPEEINAIEQALRRRPELLDYWFRHVPLSLDQIQAKH
jgi:hypothetical protein